MYANKSIGDRVSFFWRSDPDRVYVGSVVKVFERTTHDWYEVDLGPEASTVWIDSREVVEVPVAQPA